MITINIVDLIFAIIITLAIMMLIRVLMELIYSDYKYFKEKERLNASKYWSEHFTEMDEEEKRRFVRKYF